MKAIALVFVLIGSVLCGSCQDVPSAISNAFTSKYKTAKNIDWSMSKGIYKVVFEHNDVIKRASFTKEGNWLETVTEVLLDELMECIVEYIEDDFSDSNILEAIYSEKPKINEYIVTIETTDELEVSEEDMNPTNDPIIIRLVFNDDCEFVRED